MRSACVCRGRRVMSAACLEQPFDSLPDCREALTAQSRHTDDLAAARTFLAVVVFYVQP